MALLSGRAVAAERSLVIPERTVCRSVLMVYELRRILGCDLEPSTVVLGSLLHGCYDRLSPRTPADHLRCERPFQALSVPGMCVLYVVICVCVRLSVLVLAFARGYVRSRF